MRSRALSDRSLSSAPLNRKHAPGKFSSRENEVARVFSRAKLQSVKSNADSLNWSITFFAAKRFHTAQFCSREPASYLPIHLAFRQTTKLQFPFQVLASWRIRSRWYSAGIAHSCFCLILTGRVLPDLCLQAARCRIFNKLCRRYGFLGN